MNLLSTSFLLIFYTAAGKLLGYMDHRVLPHLHISVLIQVNMCHNDNAQILENLPELGTPQKWWCSECRHLPFLPGLPWYQDLLQYCWQPPKWISSSSWRLEKSTCKFFCYKRSSFVELIWTKRLIWKCSENSYLPPIVVNSPGSPAMSTWPILNIWVSTLVGCHWKGKVSSPALIRMGCNQKWPQGFFRSLSTIQRNSWLFILKAINTLGAWHFSWLRLGAIFMTRETTFAQYGSVSLVPCLLVELEFDLTSVKDVFSMATSGHTQR